MPTSFVSNILTNWRNRKVPSPYRQPTSNAIPIAGMMWWGFWAYIAAVIWGISAHQGWVPQVGHSLFRAVNTYVISPVCTFARIDKFVLCPNPNSSPIPHTQTASPSQREQVIYIQQKLLDAGLNVNVDGIPGPQTRKQIDLYLQYQGVEIPPNADIGLIYQYFRRINKED